MFLPTDGYFTEVARICRKYGVLFVVDSVICGFARMGNWFGIERFGVSPDMIVFAKGVSSGYLPLGGVMVNGRVADPFWNQEGHPFLHGTTYAGTATPPTIASNASVGAGTTSYSSSTPAVCTIDAASGVVTFTGPGSCTIGASTLMRSSCG